MGSFVENVNKMASLTPTNMEDLSLIVQNIDAINQVAPLADDLNDIIDNIIPNLDEILQADNSATTATEQATIATTQAGIATTKAVEAEQFRNEAEAFSLSKAFVVDTIEALSTIPSSYTTAIVKDLNRGGTFIWSATGTANGGTIFAGATGYWNRQYSGAVNVKWFGAKSINGDYAVTSSSFDSSEYVSNAINYVCETQEELLVDGQFLITMPITITSKINIKGTGKPNADSLDKGSWLVYDNSSSYYMFNFSNTISYDNYSSIIENIGFRSVNKSSGVVVSDSLRFTNQNCIVFSKQFSYKMNNVEFVGFTGYAEYYDNTCYGQSLYKQGVTYRKCGGAIGTNGSTIVCTNYRFVDINFEWGVLSTSPQNYIFDLYGFREGYISNVIVEGNGVSATQIPFRMSGYSETLENVHFEINGVSPNYHIYITNSAYASGSNVDINISRIYGGKIYTDLTYGYINIKDFSYYYGDDLSTILTRGVSSYAIYKIDGLSVRYLRNVPSYVILKKVFSSQENIEFTANLEQSMRTKFSPVDGAVSGALYKRENISSYSISTYHSTKLKISNLTGFGRVFELSISDLNNVGSVTTIITPTSSQVGQLICVSALVYLSCDPLLDSYIRYNVSGLTGQSSSYFKQVNNQWTTISVMLRPSNTNPITLNFLKMGSDFSSPATVYVANVTTSYGTAIFNNSDICPLNKTISGMASSIPTTGDYIVGDILYNSTPAPSGNIGWVCTTAGTPGAWKTFGAITA